MLRSAWASAALPGAFSIEGLISAYGLTAQQDLASGATILSRNAPMTKAERDLISHRISVETGKLQRFEIRAPYPKRPISKANQRARLTHGVG